MFGFFIPVYDPANQTFPCCYAGWIIGTKSLRICRQRYQGVVTNSTDDTCGMVAFARLLTITLTRIFRQPPARLMSPTTVT